MLEFGFSRMRPLRQSCVLKMLTEEWVHLECTPAEGVCGRSRVRQRRSWVAMPPPRGSLGGTPYRNCPLFGHNNQPQYPALVSHWICASEGAQILCEKQPRPHQVELKAVSCLYSQLLWQQSLPRRPGQPGSVSMILRNADVYEWADTEKPALWSLKKTGRKAIGPSSCWVGKMLRKGGSCQQCEELF